jgi:hypothetical protein
VEGTDCFVPRNDAWIPACVGMPAGEEHPPEQESQVKQ